MNTVEKYNAPMCECGHPLHFHHVDGRCEGEYTGNGAVNDGFSGCSCTKERPVKSAPQSYDRLDCLHYYEEFCLLERGDSYAHCKDCKKFEPKPPTPPQSDALIEFLRTLSCAVIAVSTSTCCKEITAAFIAYESAAKGVKHE
jgi:hypothetical protein